MNVKSVRKFVASLALGGTLIFGGTTSAADIDSDGIQLFTQALNEISRTDDRVFHHDFLVTIPDFIGNLAVEGITENDALRGKGNLIVRMVDDDGNVSDQNTPFYMVQSGKNFTIYYQNEKKKWVKTTVPDHSAEFIEKFSVTSDTKIIQRLVKDVDILQNNDATCTMRVNLDGNKISDLYKEISAANPANSDNPMALAIKNQLESYIEAGLRNSDAWYIWTVDKTNWQTVKLSLNLSDIVKSIAQTALNDNSKDWGIFRDTLETLAFYSDLRMNVSYLNPAAAKQLEIPAKVLKAKEAK